MQKQVLTWNGTSIQDATYEASIPIENDSLGGADIVWGSRPGARPGVGGKRLSGRYLPLLIRLKSALASHHSNWSTLKRLFSIENSTLKRLVIQDTADSNKQWYVDGTPEAMTMRGNRVEINIALDKSYWQTVNEPNTTWNIAGTPATSPNVVIGGNCNTRPRLRYRPTSAKAGSYLNAVFVPARNPSSRVLVDHPYDLTDAAWNTVTLVGAGKMRSDGNDLRAWEDGVEIDRWLSVANVGAANPRVWCNLSFLPGQQATLSASIASSGTVTAVKSSVPITGFPAQGMFLIGTEMYTYTEKDDPAQEFRGITRAAKNTAMAAHAVGDAVYWIEHDIWLRYGLSTAAAKVNDDSKKPIFDLATSTNTSWVYANFKREPPPPPQQGVTQPTIGGQWRTRSGQVQPNGIPTMGSLSGGSYPASKIGVNGGSRFIAETGVTDFAEWWLNSQVGFTAWNFTNGERYRSSAKWFRTCYLKAEAGDGGADDVRYDIATPPGAGSVNAWSDSRALGGTYHTLRMYADISAAAARSDTRYAQVSDLTLTLDANNVPVAFIAPELANQYFCTARMTHVQSGEWIQFALQMELNQTVEINCEAMTVTYLKDNSNVYAAVTRSSKRGYFFDLPPGTNTFTWEETGVTGSTVDIYRRDRETV